MHHPNHVLTREQIYEKGCKVHLISLICSPDRLRERLVKDIDAGIRTEEILARSLLSIYRKIFSILHVNYRIIMLLILPRRYGWGFLYTYR